MYVRSTGDNRLARPPLSPLRVVGFVAAVALGAVGIWLVSAGLSQKWTQLGVLAGLWGLLIGAFAAFGPRRAAAPDEAGVVPGLPVRSDLAVAAAAQTAVIARLDDTVWQRDYEARLELLLRREIQSAVGAEVAALRAEVAQLRTELIENVGGQLRLERIETTRVIGSDIEALQREISMLKSERPMFTSRELRVLPGTIDADFDPGFDAGYDRADESPDEAAGRRRRRNDDDAEDDLLARILARETAAGRHSR